MVKDKVSIICSVFNGERYLKETISSCLNQEDIEFEIIIIDDSSSDNSIEIINEMMHSNKNIKLAINDTNLGFTRSVNKASLLCSGEYLLVIGHDDKIPPTHIRNLISEFDDDTSFIHCNSIFIDENGKEYGLSRNDAIQIKKNKTIMRELSFGNCVSSTGLLMRTEYFNKVKGYPEDYRNYGEWELWIKLASLGNVKYSKKTRAYYRIHKTNVTKTFRNKDVKVELKNYYQRCRSLAYSNLELSYYQRIMYTIEGSKKMTNRYMNGIKRRLKSNTIK